MARSTPPPPQCAAEVEAVLKVLDDPRFTAEAYAQSVIKQIAGMTFPQLQVLALRIELLDLVRRVRTRGNVDAIGLRHAALQLFRSAQAWARPVPVPQAGDVAQQQLPTPSQCAAEIEKVLKALNDPVLTAGAFARSNIEQIRDMTFPPERIVTMRSELLAFEGHVRTLGNDHAAGLRHAAWQLFRRAQELARPVSLPSPDYIVNSIFGGLQEQFGWSSLTIDLLRQELKPGETIKAYNASGITTNLRRIDKEELIIKYRPHAMIPQYFERWRKAHTRDGFFSNSRDSER